MNKYAFLFYFQLLQSICSGQNQIDLRGMPSFSTDYKINRRIAITGISNGLLTNDFHELGFAFLDIGVKYRLHRNISVNGNYRLMYKRNLNNSSSFRNIYYFDIDFAKSINRLQLGGTLRTQLTDFPPEQSLDYLIYNRTKLNAKYRVNYYFHPIFEIEVFTPLNHPIRKQMDQFRFLLGFQHVWNENLKLEFFIQYRQQINRYPKNTVFLGAVNLIYRI